MDSLSDSNAAKPSLKRGASVDISLIHGSPLSAFTTTHLQASQGSWQQNPSIQADARFKLFDEHGDTRPLLPAFLSGSDGYGKTQFGSLVEGLSTLDSKLSYLSAATSGIAGLPLSIAGKASGLTNEDVSAGKLIMLPQRWGSPVPPPCGSCPMDPSCERLPAQVMNFTSPACLPSLPADPGFADRAAEFSAFGSMGLSESSLGGDGSTDRNRAKLHIIKPLRQFDYTSKRSAPSSQSGLNSYNDNQGLENMQLSTKEAGSAVPMEECCQVVETHMSFLPIAHAGEEGGEGDQKHVCASVNVSDESMGREVSPSSGQASMQGLLEGNGRKRKAELQNLKDGCVFANNPKDMDPDDGRPKCHGGGENAFDNSFKPQKQSNSGNSEESSPKSAKEASKPPEAPKSDFIHVRARRGQATDSHSLAERVRREKISERMKFLQDLVPGCSKVTGKAVMLDEIINYVQSLQRQVEFLSMKLAAVNPKVEFSIDNLFARERAVQPRVATAAAGFVIQSPSLFPHAQPHAQIQSLDQCHPHDVEAFGSDSVFRQSSRTPLAMETYGDSASQHDSQAWDDELQSVVQMSFAQRQAALDLQGSLFHGQMKVEL